MSCFLNRQDSRLWNFGDQVETKWQTLTDLDCNLHFLEAKDPGSCTVHRGHDGVQIYTQRYIQDTSHHLHNISPQFLAKNVFADCATLGH